MSTKLDNFKMKDLVKKNYLNEDRQNPNIIRVSRTIENIIKNAKKDEISIHTIRIIVSIVAKIKHDQLTKPKQLNLFNDTFLKDSDSLVKFVFNYPDLLPENYSSIKPLKDSFEFLIDYQNTYHKIINENGEDMEIGGGIVIGKPNFNHKKKTVSFHMNSYWYHAFLNISSSNFNRNLLSIYFKTSSVNTAVFYSWLNTLPEEGGSQPSIKWFNEKFKTTYESYSDIDRYLLRNIKKDMDKWGDISFGYNKDLKNKNLINIQRFDKSLPQRPENSHKDVDYSKIKYKITYLQDKHGLSKEQGIMLKSVFIKYGYDIIDKLFKMNKKSWTKEVKGDEFIKRFTLTYQAFLKKRAKIK